MSVLSAQHLAKRFRSRQVVKDVSLTVSSGEVVGLLGPNGAGKTTSFHMILGLIPIDSGTLHLDENDITMLPMDARARLGLGYLPQESSVFRKLTVEQNILAVLEVLGLRLEQRHARLEELLYGFHLTTVRKNLGSSLSGGERRRTEIARALASNPELILLDEPFAGVDPISVLDIQRIIKHLAQMELGILITDHNVRETLGICDRAYIVNDGAIIAEGPPEAILSNEQVREVYLGKHFSL